MEACSSKVLQVACKNGRFQVQNVANERFQLPNAASSMQNGRFQPQNAADSMYKCISISIRCQFQNAATIVTDTQLAGTSQSKVVSRRVF
jgi:hypothetical protein